MTISLGLCISYNISSPHQLHHPAPLKLRLCGDIEIRLLLVLFTGRILQSGISRYLNLLTNENKHFRPTGATHCTDSCEIWHDQGARGSAWPHEISRQLVHGVGTQHKKIYKNFHFLVVASQGRIPWPISKIFSLYTPHYPTLLVFQIWRFTSQVTELLLRNRASVT